jgi:hypothetical protein
MDEEPVSHAPYGGPSYDDDTIWTTSKRLTWAEAEAKYKALDERCIVAYKARADD